MSTTAISASTILAIDPVFADYRHSVVNGWQLKALALACGCSRVVFAAHPGHYEAVLSNVPSLAGRIEFRPIEVVPPGGISAARFRYHLRALTTSIAATKPTCLICLGLTPETLFAIGCLRPLHPRLPIVAILHGDLSKVTGWRSRDPRRRLFDNKSAIRVAIWAGVRFVVLEQYVRSAALELALLPASRCDVWPHPIADEEHVTEPPPLHDGPRRLGFLGFARAEKGFDDFLALVTAAEEQRADWCEFRLIGSALPSDYSSLPDRLIVVPNVIERRSYVRALQDIDYACVFLNSDTYRLTSSGSMIDAVAALRPMIGLETSATRAMFDGLSVGYFSRSMDELRGLIVNRDALSDAAAYRRFQDGLQVLGRGRSTEDLAEQMATTIQTVMRW